MVVQPSDEVVREGHDAGIPLSGLLLQRLRKNDVEVTESKRRWLLGVERGQDFVMGLASLGSGMPASEQEIEKNTSGVDVGRSGDRRGDRLLRSRELRCEPARALDHGRVE